MKWMWRSSVLAIAVIAIAFAACGDGGGPADPNGNGTPDTQAPGVDSVVAVDVNHVDVYFNEDVPRVSAEKIQNYTIVERAPGGSGRVSASPGDTILLNSVSLKTDGKTASIQTIDNMADVPYEIFVCCIKDLSGNEMSTTESKTFTGTAAQDITPPEIVLSSPLPDATDVGTAQGVVVHFSEAVRFLSVRNGFSWTGGSGVSYDMDDVDEIMFVITPRTSLSIGTTYTVTFSNVTDYANNVMPTASWSFTTTPTLDTSPPTLESSSPSDGEQNVDVNANLILNFSEAVESYFEALITPNPGDGVSTWSDEGRTVTFDPDEPLQDDTQYYLLITPGAIRDLAGNGIEDAVTILFSTGSGFVAGSFVGTVSGDPGTQAVNPAGTIVIAPTVPPTENQGQFDVPGSGVVGSGGSYSVSSIPDGVYYPIGVMDSNGNGKLDPDLGDAVGWYGVDVRQLDITPDSVTISGGNRATDVDFPMFDQSALAGIFSYSGTVVGVYKVFIGAFDVNGFDINNLGPADFGTDELWPYEDEFTMNEMSTGYFVPGNYYVGAYMDLDGNEEYDAASEPAGFYGGVPIPTAVELTGGRDALEVRITLEDPAGGFSSTPGPWGSSGKKNAEWFKRLSAIVRQATE